MERTPRISEKRQRHLLLWCWLSAIFVILYSGLFFAETVPAEDSSFQEKLKVLREFNKKVSVLITKRKAALQKRVTTPLDKKARKLLMQLLDEKGNLEEILSNKLYLTYLKTHVGADYEDYPAYLAAMPSPELKIEALLIFKEVLPLKQTSEELQAWIRFYFQKRRFYAIPNILNDRNKYMKHGQGDYLDLLTPSLKIPATKSEEKAARAKMDEILLISKAPRTLARVETKVYHDTWRKLLETHGPHEGLLRCAIANPEDFALTRSFFENTQALEQWILAPLESSDTKKKMQNKKEDTSK